MATIAGFANWPFGNFLFLKKFWFEHFIANLTFEETVVVAKKVHPFDWGVALPSVALAVAGIAVGLWYNVAKKGDLGLVRKGGLPGLVHKVLKNKYYLDHLWTGVVVGSIKGPIAKMAYWFNQEVIDRIVNTAGKSAVGLGKFTYEVIDQKGIDGIVNGTGITASTSGGILRRLQTGRVQSYAAMFVASVGLIGLGLALFV